MSNVVSFHILNIEDKKVLSKFSTKYEYVHKNGTDDNFIAIISCNVIHNLPAFWIYFDISYGTEFSNIFF